MPQIIVTAHDNEGTVTLRERINTSDFESERFAANLVERLGWAVLDADEAEHIQSAPQPRKRITERPITGGRTRERGREPELEPVGSA
jgi:hypothetical protein